MKEAVKGMAIPVAGAGVLALGLFLGVGLFHTLDAQSQEAVPTPPASPPLVPAITPSSESPAATHRAQVDFGSPVSDF